MFWETRSIHNGDASTSASKNGRPIKQNGTSICGAYVFEKFGGATAAPVFGEIVKRITKTKNILSENISSLSQVKNFENGYKEELKDILMPDLKDLNLKDVIQIFKNSGIEVKVKGTGLVKEQYPKAGESLQDVKEIRIVLK